MLLANIKAAEFIVAKVGPAAVLRRHPFPGNKKCTYFQKVLALSGESAKLGRGLNMQ
jgi:exoribonuclease R